MERRPTPKNVLVSESTNKYGEKIIYRKDVPLAVCPNGTYYGDLRAGLVVHHTVYLVTGEVAK